MYWSVKSGGYRRVEGRERCSEIIQDMGFLDDGRGKRKALVCVCVPEETSWELKETACLSLSKAKLVLNRFPFHLII